MRIPTHSLSSFEIEITSGVLKPAGCFGDVLLLNLIQTPSAAAIVAEVLILKGTCIAIGTACMVIAARKSQAVADNLRMLVNDWQT